MLIAHAEDFAVHARFVVERVSQIGAGGIFALAPARAVADCCGAGSAGEAEILRQCR